MKVVKMKDLVTGDAGFIGSNLTDRLLDKGRRVVGLDDFSRNYDPKLKRLNLESALKNRKFELIQSDILQLKISDELDGVDTVYHLAGQPGVQTSWGAGFENHVSRNVLTTQRLLEECLEKGVRRVVIASSSSIYGHTERESKETCLARPRSPCGVSKWAKENLEFVYAWRVLDVVSLRLFSAYGPR